ncbi:hypothetical protein SLS64_002984 [Diaporthe eres]
MPGMSYGRTVFKQGSTMEGELSPACVAWKKELQQDLESVQTVGDFAIQRIHTQFVNPGLEIDGCLIPLPLIPLFADQIKAVAKPAPISRDGGAVVDYSARLTWELSHDHFRIANPAWSEFLESLKQDAAQRLGLALSDLIVEPDKLLLYEKGSFSRHHKDSETKPGVIGTLVICLPSEHEGGHVHLAHAGKEHVFATAFGSAFNLSSLAWYSDATHEVKEVTSGHRLDLNYSIIQKAGAGKSAGFFAKQQAQVKARIARWPGDLSKLVYFLEHKYPQASLSPTNLEQHDRAIFDVLSPACSEAGVYLLLGNITKQEYDQDYDPDYHGDDGEKMGISLDFLCNAVGRKIASGIEISTQHIVAADPYSNRAADSEDEGEEDESPNKLRYHNSALVLIPRNKLHDLLGSGADIWAMLLQFIADQNKNPRDANLRADLLKFMDKVLDFGLPPAGILRRYTPDNPAQTLTGLAIMRSSWSLNDIPLYRKAIRYCVAGGNIPQDLPKRLATLATQSRSPHAVDWNKCLGGLLECPLDLTRIFAALNEFEKALEQQDFQESFRTWVTPLKRSNFDSKVHLTVDDHDFIGELASSLWHDDAWVEQQFVELFGTCLASGFTDEALKLAQSIKPDARHQLHPPGPRLVFTGVRTAYVPNLAHELVRILGDLMDLHKAPFMESLRGVFEDLLRNYALSPFPDYPVRPAGWAHKPRACTAACGPCRGLDLFLTDQQQQAARFSLLKKDRDHLEKRLPRGLFRCVVDPSSKPHTLLVHKNSQDGEFRQALATYEARAKDLRLYTKDLREEHFKKILGDDLYRELVLLEGPPGSGGSGGRPSQTAAGVKREAEEELWPPPRPGVRQWIA